MEGITNKRVKKEEEKKEEAQQIQQN